MAEERATVSVKDVAALAGVSLGTVSNTLNSPEKVAQATRERVNDAISKLGWVRNESARHLAGGRSRSIGMVVMDIGNPFFTDILLGAEEYVYSVGHSVHIGNSALDRDRETAHLDRFEQDRVRGILVAPIYYSERVREVRRRGIPVVLLDRADVGADSCSVSVDDVEGGRIAVEHLLSLGHRRLAVVGGSGDVPQIRDRRLGAELARVAAADREVTLLTISTRGMDARSGAQAAHELALLPTGERPTAAFATNDLLAIGLLQGFVSIGMSVPTEMAIIGYDDIEFAGSAAVPLSSVRQPRRELGQRGAELLFAEIRAAEAGSAHEHQQVRFSPELVVRRSTAGTPHV